jgi:acyl-CoA hydrolase
MEPEIKNRTLFAGARRLSKTKMALYYTPTCETMMTNEGKTIGLDIRGGDPAFPAKCSSDSLVMLNQQMMPSDANPLGNVHGGHIMKLIDEAGGLAAMRHARRPVVTVAIDSITFLSPVRVGHLLNLRSSVNWVGKTSMEVGIRVEAENPITGEITHTNSAYAVFVALDDQGKPCPVPPLILENDEDRRHCSEAEARQAIRLEVSNKKKNRRL